MKVSGFLLAGLAALSMMGGALKPKAADPKVLAVQFFPNPKLKKP